MTRRRDSENESRLDAATIQEFDRLRGQLKAFYAEISILSKKHPDGKLNKFKLGFINATLKKATVLLGESYRPFAEFEALPDDDMPSASDAGMMLSQYLNSMERFRREHSDDNKFGAGRLWRTRDGQEIRTD